MSDRQERSGAPAASPLDFSGRVVLVTGGGKGVGRGISLVFLDAGATVVICSRSRPDELPACGDNRAQFTPCDVTDREQIDACIRHVIDQFGRLDVLVNNVGGTPFRDAASASPRFSEKIIGLNLLSPMHFSEAANAVMQRQPGGGVIVNIASVSAIRPSPGTAAYGAAKAALLTLGECQAREWAPKVRVNAVIVGLVRTELAHLHYGDEAGIAAVAATIPMQRMAAPADVGNACLYLASDLCAAVTGTHLTLHGGGESPRFLDAANAGN